MKQNANAKPKFKHVDFDLPFVLFLRDSFRDRGLEKWAEAYLTGKRPLPYSRYAPPSENSGGIIIGGNLPVHLAPKELASCYVIKLPEFAVELIALRRVNPYRGSLINGEVPGDRIGRASFSSVRITFNLSQVKTELHGNTQWFCHSAIRAINHFIEHYRIIADRPYTDSVTTSTIQQFFLRTEFDDGQVQYLEYGDGPYMIGFGGAIPDNSDITLREAVAKPESPEIHLTLEANIKNYFELENWRLSLIETAVMFEAWLSRYIRMKFADKGVLPSEIDVKFIDDRGHPKSITAIAKKLVLEATNFDFSSTTEYQNWETGVRDIRNELIHGKLFDVTPQQAKDAYKAVQMAIKLLLSK